MKKLYDVYFKPVSDILITIEADNSKDLFEQFESEINSLSREKLIEKFLSAYDYEGFEITDNEEIGEVEDCKMNNIKLNEIQTKYGTIYIESLNGNREEQDRIKIFDSDKKYIDYFSIEFLGDCATEMGTTLEEEYATRVRNFRETETIDELLYCISADIVNWSYHLTDFAFEDKSFVNHIGKIYTLLKE